MSIQYDFEITNQSNTNFVDGDSITDQQLRQFFSVQDDIITFKAPIEQSVTLSQLLNNKVIEFLFFKQLQQQEYKTLYQKGDYLVLLNLFTELIDFYMTALEDDYYFNRIQEDNIYFLLKPKSHNDQQIVFTSDQFRNKQYTICIAAAPSKTEGVLQQDFQNFISQSFRKFHQGIEQPLTRSTRDVPEIVVKFVENIKYVTRAEQIDSFRQILGIQLQDVFKNENEKFYDLLFEYQQPQLTHHVDNDEIIQRLYNYQCQQHYQRKKQENQQNYRKVINLFQYLEKYQLYIRFSVSFIQFLKKKQFLNVYESYSQLEQQQIDVFMKYFEENVTIDYLYGYLVKKGLLMYLQQGREDPEQCLNELFSEYAKDLNTEKQTFKSVLQQKKQEYILIRPQQNKFERDIKKLVIELVLSQI